MVEQRGQVDDEVVAKVRPRAQRYLVQVGVHHERLRVELAGARARGEVDAATPGLPIGRAAIRRSGDDLTVITYGGLVATAESAAELAAEQHGWSLEIVDLRSLNPLDFDTVAESVRRTGRCVVMHEGPRTLGFGAELAARITEKLFYDLEAPVLRATGFDTPYPPARLEKLWLPGVDRLLDCVERALEMP